MGDVPRRVGVVALLLATLLAFGVTGGTAGAVPLAVSESSTPHFPLSRRVSITSQGNGFLPVRLLSDVRFASSGSTPHATIQVDGGGGFAGVAFVQDDASLTGALLAGRIDPQLTCAVRCMTGSGGIVVRSSGLPRASTDVSAPHILPAGAYRMYVLSASGPVTVRLSFPELPGTDVEESLLAFTYTGATVALPGNRAEVADQGSVYFAGETGAIATSGILFTYVEVVGESSRVGQIYTCHYGGREPEAGAYALGCPGGTMEPSDPIVNLNAAPFGYRVTRHAFRANVPAGEYGLGGGFVTADNTLETANTVAVWLSY